MLSHHREIRDFLTNHGATAVSIQWGGRHPKIEFDFKGQHYAEPMAISPSDPNAHLVAIRELKKKIGPAVEIVRSEPRKLDDMIPPPAYIEDPSPSAPEPKPEPQPQPADSLEDSYIGAMAMYSNGIGTGAISALRLRFVLPLPLVRSLKLPGQLLKVSRLDADTWQLTPCGDPPSRTHPGQAIVRRDHQRFVADVTGEEIISGYEKFGVSPAEYIVVNNDMVVHLNTATMRPVFVRGDFTASSEPPKPRPAPAEVPPPPPEPTPPPPADDSEIVTLDQYMRQILRMIVRAEMISAHKLTKVEKDNGKTAWIWRAMDIQLDDAE